MKPYFETRNGCLYLGDSREMINNISTNTSALITDPVWPNNKIKEFEHINPYDTLSDVLKNTNSCRIILHLGCDSDPRILMSVPKKYKFIRVCWLRYAFPHPKGRILYSGDVAYAFGDPPKSRRGARILPGEICRTDSRGRLTSFMCERPVVFVMWLVQYYGDNFVIDPFIGSGTTAVACERQGIRWIGVEIDEKTCEMAAMRIEEETRQLKLFKNL